MRLMHIDQLDTFYKSYRIKNSSGVTSGHRDQKVIFTKKCYFSNRLHGMDMWLMHIYQIDTSTEVIGLKIHLGSFGVTGGQKVIFT